MKSFVWIIVLIVACIFLWNISPWIVIIVGIGIVAWIIFLIRKSKSKSSTQAHSDPVRTPPTTQIVDPRPKQYEETLALLKNTTNCETFLGRMDFAYSIANETHNQSWLDYLNTNVNKLTKDFIDRAVSHEQGILSRMKTGNGKCKHFDRFVDTMTTAFKNCDKSYASTNLSYLTSALERINLESHEDAIVPQPSATSVK